MEAVSLTLILLPAFSHAHALSSRVCTRSLSFSGQRQHRGGMQPGGAQPRHSCCDSQSCVPARQLASSRSPVCACMRVRERDKERKRGERGKRRGREGGRERERVSKRERGSKRERERERERERAREERGRKEWAETDRTRARESHDTVSPISLSPGKQFQPTRQRLSPSLSFVAKRFTLLVEPTASLTLRLGGVSRCLPTHLAF